MNHIVAPSLLAADFTRLHKDIEMFQNSEAQWLHLDVMDGVFVPNISFGPNIIKQIRPLSDKFYDVHLMSVHPENFIDALVDAGSNLISFHIEASNHAHRLIYQIKEKGIQAGIALNPHTDIQSIKNVLEDVDLVVLMSVNPGFGGQKFIYNTLSKIKELDKIRTERNLDFKIEIDGGVGLQNAEKILEAGADVLVAGSSVFKSENPSKSIQQLLSLRKNNLIA